MWTNLTHQHVGGKWFWCWKMMLILNFEREVKVFPIDFSGQIFVCQHLGAIRGTKCFRQFHWLQYSTVVGVFFVHAFWSFMFSWWQLTTMSIIFILFWTFWQYIWSYLLHNSHLCLTLSCSNGNISTCEILGIVKPMVIVSFHPQINKTSLLCGHSVL